MAAKERRGDNQKLKMLYLVKIFSEETDDNHALTIPEIRSKLEAYGVNAERKTLYQDFEELRQFGLDIIAEKKGNMGFYHLGSREFELPELKLLVDSVQSAKFITDKKSNELIKKLESLVSKYEAKQLHRQVVISGRIKAMNESIYYNVDKLHEAIGSDRQIRFLYYQWNVKKEMELRKNGAEYHISPWGLMWDDENYYLVGYDSEEKKIKHYRVDKMLQINVTDDKREGKEAFKLFDMPKYTKSLFGMYGGTQLSVTLLGSVDRCSYVDESHDGWMFSGRCLRVRTDGSVLPLYLYYHFCLEETKQFVRNIAVGATMPSINTKLMSEVPVAIPEQKVQRRIADILSSIDNTIELNEAINENLAA